jgi:hypothetical protein
MNNGDEYNTELLTVHEIARLLKVPVSWLHGHTNARSIACLDNALGSLGHSTPDITREIYLHAIPEDQRRAVESVERLVFALCCASASGTQLLDRGKMTCFFPLGVYSHHACQ